MSTKCVMLISYGQSQHTNSKIPVKSPRSPEPPQSRNKRSEPSNHLKPLPARWKSQRAGARSPLPPREPPSPPTARNPHPSRVPRSRSNSPPQCHESPCACHWDPYSAAYLQDGSPHPRRDRRQPFRELWLLVKVRMSAQLLVYELASWEEEEEGKGG